MLVTGLTREQLEKVAREVGVRQDVTTLNTKGTRHRVKVYPDVPARAYTPARHRRRGERGDAPYQRTSGNVMFREGARVNAVCWHGFRDYFRAAFKHNPQATFRTAFDTWRGAADFEARYRATGHKNIGSRMYPICAAEACRCPESGMAV